jgi:peroxiredoxin
MKKYAIFVLLLVTSSVQVWPQEVLTIKGTGFKNYTELSLKGYSDKSLGYEPIETLQLNEKGTFSIQTPFKEANLYELNFDEKDFVHLSVKSGGIIQVERKEDITVIEGSESSLKILDFQNQNQELQTRYFGSLKAEMDEAMKNEDQARLGQLQQEAETAVQKFLVEFRALIVSLGVSPEAFYALQYSDFNKELEFIETRLETFKKEAPASILTRSLEKLVYQAKNTAVGKTPPDFRAFDSKGNEVSPELLKGKVVLIDFWAYWCRACRIENPEFARLYEEYKNKGFHILSISQDVEHEHWKNAIKQDGIEAFQHVFDEGNRISGLYSISSLPQNLLLDEDGVIIAKNLNADLLERLLADR